MKAVNRSKDCYERYESRFDSVGRHNHNNLDKGCSNRIRTRRLNKKLHLTDEFRIYQIWVLCDYVNKEDYLSNQDKVTDDMIDWVEANDCFVSCFCPDIDYNNRHFFVLDCDDVSELCISKLSKVLSEMPSSVKDHFKNWSIILKDAYYETSYPELTTKIKLPDGSYNSYMDMVPSSIWRQ